MLTDFQDSASGRTRLLADAASPVLFVSPSTSRDGDSIPFNALPSRFELFFDATFAGRSSELLRILLSLVLGAFIVLRCVCVAERRLEKEGGIGLEILMHLHRPKAECG